MPVRSILRFPAAVLLDPTQRVTDFSSPELAALLVDLRDSIDVGFTRGLGLAAPQIGSSLRAAVARMAMPTDKRPGRVKLIDLVNLEVERSGGEVTTTMREGCLSLPNEWCQVPRYRRVYARWQSATGESMRGAFEGLTAQTLQHEADHLDGRLILDRIGPMAAERIRARVGSPA